MPHELPEMLRTRRLNLGAAIRAARRHANLTQEGLAQAAGIDRSSVQRIEHGLNDARISHLWAIADALGVPVMRLLDE